MVDRYKPHQLTDDLPSIDLEETQTEDDAGGDEDDDVDDMGDPFSDDED